MPKGDSIWKKLVGTKDTKGKNKEEKTERTRQPSDQDQSSTSANLQEFQTMFGAQSAVPPIGSSHETRRQGYGPESPTGKQMAQGLAGPSMETGHRDTHDTDQQSMNPSQRTNEYMKEFKKMIRPHGNLDYDAKRQQEFAEQEKLRESFAKLLKPDQSSNADNRNSQKPQRTATTKYDTKAATTARAGMPDASFYEKQLSQARRTSLSHRTDSFSPDEFSPGDDRAMMGLPPLNEHNTSSQIENPSRTEEITTRREERKALKKQRRGQD
jgi:hypothetical protein